MKRIYSKLVKKVSNFYGHRALATLLQHPDNGTYSKQYDSSLRPPLTFRLRSILILSFHLRIGIPSVLFPLGF